MSYEDRYVEYKSQLEIELFRSAQALLPFVPMLQNVDQYSQLLELDPDLLGKLVRHERATVNLTEHLNPAIDFQSSGHHRDKLEILQDALKGHPMATGLYIYMRDDGGLEFNLAENVKAIS